MEKLTASINDTAKALGLGRTSIYSLINAERLEVVKIGRRTLVRVDSIQRLIVSGKVAMSLPFVTASELRNKDPQGGPGA